MKFTAILFSLAAAVPLVSAHGYVSQLVVDGKSYQGPVPNGKAIDSPVRQISTIDPVKGANNKAIVCGANAKKAALTVPAKPGSTVEFHWVAGNGVKWPHNTGPMIEYMASCGGDDCSKFDAANAKWFKVSEIGRKNNGKGDWAQADLMKGTPRTITLPENLKPGGYLIRHEIIALHLAQSPGGAEFYPSCSQLLVKGSGTGTPDETVSFPGAYTDKDKGILVNAFDAGAKYVFPGGAVATLSGGGKGANNAASSPSTDASAPAETESSEPESESEAPAPAPTKTSKGASSTKTAKGASSTKSCSSNADKKRMLKRHARARLASDH